METLAFSSGICAEFSSTVEQATMEIGSVKVPVEGPRILRGGRCEVHVRNDPALPMERIDSRRFGRVLVKSFFHAPRL